MAKQQYFDVVEFRRGADSKELMEAISTDPSQSGLGPNNRSVLKELLRRNRKRIFYTTSQDYERLRDIVEDMDFMIVGIVPRAYIELSLKKAPGKKQDFKKMKSEIEKLGNPKSIVVNEKLVYANRAEIEQIHHRIETCGYAVVSYRRHR